MKHPAPPFEYSIGIDVGGTTTKIGLVDREGHLLDRLSMDSQATPDARQYSAKLAELVQTMIRTHAAEGKIQGIGIGAPGVDERAEVMAAANMPFSEPVPLAKWIEDATSLPSRLIKDSSAAIIGERAFGGAKGMDHFVLLTLGTGLGSALMIHGKVIGGANGLASEYGHSPAVPDGRQCNCGKKGCLETYVSATGLKRTVFELLATMKTESPLRDADFHHLDARMIFDAAESQDPVALEAFRYTGVILGRAIAGLIVLLDPQAVFLAGGLIHAGPRLFDPVKESIETHLLPMFQGSCPVLPSQLGADDTGILGAAAILWDDPKS
ncbi:MAG: ROK family protein [Haliscomenobacter sp.]|nr:ROK family protein [Haliscomenobacter sp.]